MIHFVLHSTQWHAVPRDQAVWYLRLMSGTYKVVVGNKGRLVVPAEVRKRCHLDEGTIMILIEADSGLILMNQEQLKARVRADMKGTSLVDELMAERKLAAAKEDGHQE